MDLQVLKRKASFLPPPSKRRDSDSSGFGAVSACADAKGELRESDKTRASCSGMLLKALCESKAPSVEASPSIADAIEEEIFQHHSNTVGKEYKASARALAANLRRNAELRGRVLKGDVTPALLARMAPADLATVQQKEEISKIQQGNLKRATLDDGGVGGATITSDYTCPECRGTRCDYLDTTRRDIGKSDTWGAKVRIMAWQQDDTKQAEH